MNSLHELQNKCQVLLRAIVQHELEMPRVEDIEAVYLAIDALFSPKSNSVIERVTPGDLVAALERIEAAGLVEEANLVRAMLYRR